MRFLLRFCCRDLRSSPARALAAVIALAVGVGAINAARCLSATLRDKLTAQSREWLAADISLEAPAQDFSRLDDTQRQIGADRTVVTETISSAESSQAPNPLMVAVKAVDPRRYPLYGAFETEPPLPPTTALCESCAVVSRDVLASLGSTIRIGQAAYHITAVIVSEPDRIVSSRNNYPRVILSEAGLERSGILEAGVRVRQRLLVRLPHGADVSRIRVRLEHDYPWADIADFRDPDPRAAAAVDMCASFLSMASWMAVAAACCGVMAIVFFHVQDRLPSVAVM
ncbi:MAG TPA: hypothetical protein VFA04_06845, partial [Bryobacteraceae bacterium]|nr:hypothetical protein [Bryobacteraceae bacterium]